MKDSSHPLIAATLLATTPRLLIVAPPNTDVFHNLSKEPLHHLVEAMLPDGIILYCSLPIADAPRPHDRSPPPSFELCQAAGLPIFQISDSDQAEFQLLHANVSDQPPSLQIDGFSLPYSTTTFETRAAEAIAYVAARLLGYRAATIAARLGFPSRSSPQLGPSVLTIDPMISRAPSSPPNRHA